MRKKPRKSYTHIRDTDKRNDIMAWVPNHSWQEISERFEVSISTLRRWYKHYQDKGSCKDWKPARLPRWKLYYRQCCTIKYIFETERPKRFPIKKIQALMPPNTHRSTVHRLVKDAQDHFPLLWYYKRDMLPLLPDNYSKKTNRHS